MGIMSFGLWLSIVSAGRPMEAAAAHQKVCRWQSMVIYRRMQAVTESRPIRLIYMPLV